MRFTPYKKILAVLLPLALIMASCSDTWDSHYYPDATGKSDLNLYDYINSQENMSIFAGMLKIAGYDTVLNQSQSYTAFVPNDTALAAWENVEEEDSIYKMVSNHIVRYSYSTTESDSLNLKMLDDKRLIFRKENGSSTFDEQSIVKNDQAVLNGMVHTLNGYSPYRMNGWEYVENATGIDSLKAYLESLNEQVLDNDASYEDDVLIDSVFKTTNVFLTSLGGIDDEDSTFTFIAPDNNAWNTAYNTISSYFKTRSVDGGTATQMANTKWSIVQDLVFRGKITTPVTDTVLTSTAGNALSNPSELLDNAEQHRLSNGYVYQNSSLNIEAEDTYCKEIKIEAEDVVSDAITINSKISELSSIGTGYDVSNGSYILSAYTSGLTQPSIKLPIPNTRSTKYNIYAVFVPKYMVDTTDSRPYYVNCSLTYVNSSGTIVLDQSLLTKAATNGTSMTKLLIYSGFEFPYSNVIGENLLTNSETEETVYKGSTPVTSTTTVWLKIQNAASSTALQKTYNRDIRLDCIILEPVQ
jgi:hypothetical protein